MQSAGTARKSSLKADASNGGAQTYSTPTTPSGPSLSRAISSPEQLNAAAARAQQHFLQVQRPEHIPDSHQQPLKCLHVYAIAIAPFSFCLWPQECESDWLMTAHPSFASGSASPSAFATPARSDGRFGAGGGVGVHMDAASLAAAGCASGQQPPPVQKRVHYGAPAPESNAASGAAGDRSSTCSSTIAHHCTCGLLGPLGVCSRTTPTHLAQRQQQQPLRHQLPLPQPQAEYIEQPAPPASRPCYIAPDARYHQALDPLSRAAQQRFAGDLRGVSPSGQGYPSLNAAQQQLHLQTGSCSPPETTSGPSSASSSTQPPLGAGSHLGFGPAKPKSSAAAVGCSVHQYVAGPSGPGGAGAHGSADRSLEQALSPKTASSLDSGCGGLSGAKGERGSSGGSSTSSHAGAGGGLSGAASASARALVRGGSGGPLSPLANMESTCTNSTPIGGSSLGLANRALVLPISGPLTNPEDTACTALPNNRRNSDFNVGPGSVPSLTQWPSPQTPEGCLVSATGRRPFLPRLTEESGTASTCTTGTGPMPTFEESPGPHLPVASIMTAPATGTGADFEREQVHVFQTAIDASSALIFFVFLIINSNYLQ